MWRVACTGRDGHELSVAGRSCFAGCPAGERQLFPGPVEVLEREGIGEDELQGGAGEEGARREDEQCRSGLLGQVAQAVPGRRGNPAEFGERGELEVEDEEGEVAIAQKEVRATEALRDLAAANPQKALTGVGAVRGGVEGVISVDQGKLACLVARRGVVEQLGEQEGEAGSGSGGREFGDGPARERGQLAGGGKGRGRLPRAVGGGKLFAELLAQGL